MLTLLNKVKPLATLLLVALFFVPGCSKPAGQKEMESGLRELRRDNYVRAKALFEKSIARRPGHIDNARAHNYLGIASWRLGQFQEAMTAFEDSRRLNPNLIEPVYNLGVLAGERDDMRNATRYLNEAATMNREDPRSLEYLAELYYQRGQFTLARNALYSALDREPRSPRIYHAIGLAHAAMEQPDQAIESFMLALESDTRYAPALYNLAVVYDAQVGDTEQARAFYKRYISVASRDEKATVARSALARLDASGALKASPTTPTVPPTDDAADRATETTPPPVATSTTAPPPTTPRVEPQTPPQESPFDTLLRQAEERARSGQLQPAIDLYVRAAELAATERRVDLQEQAYREAVRVALDQPRAHALLGHHLYERGRNDQALRSFRQAAALNADYAPAQLGLARIAARNNDFEAAMVHYRSAIASDPRLADAQWELAQLFDRNLELPENAARTYREFAATFRGDARSRQALSRAEELAPTPKPVTPPPTTATRGAVVRPQDTATIRTLDYRAPTTINADAANQAFNRAVVYQGQQDLDRAIYFYLRSLENNDRNTTTFYNLGICYSLKGEEELARASYHHALRLDPNLTDAKYNLSLLYLEAKDNATATRMLEDIVATRPDYASAHHALGTVLAANPATVDRARLHYEKFLSLAPNDRSAPAIRAWLSGQ